MRQTHYEPLTDNRCDHGERRDRTTSEGTPLCALCRHAARQRPTIDPNAPDYAALAANDDTWADDQPRTVAVIDPAQPSEVFLAHLFAPNSGRRVTAMLERWRDHEPAGMLF